MSMRISILSVITVIILSGCTQGMTSYKGNYRNVLNQKSYDTTEKISNEQNRISKSGYAVQVRENRVILIPVNIGDHGKIEANSKQPRIILTEDENRRFKYVETDGSRMMTFMFSGKTMIVDEYSSDSNGTYIMTERKVYERL